MKKLLLLAVFLIFISQQTLGATLTVCASGCNQTTIQAGINNATNYDVIKIVDGREYLENVAINKTGIYLTSNATSGNMPVIAGTGNSVVSLL